MPIYEYECSKCGVVEAIQKFEDSPLTKCPVCGTSDPRKILSASAFHLKGGGWYKSDYCSTKKADSKPATTSDSAASDPAPKTGCGGGCKCH